MLDLNYVRGNLERVRVALEARGFPTAALDDFAALDAERRARIAESDALNARRNTSSREIGALMKEGKKEEAEARRKEVGELKEPDLVNWTDISDKVTFPQGTRHGTVVRVPMAVLNALLAVK